MNVAGADESRHWHGLLPLRNLFRRQHLFCFMIEDVVFRLVGNGLVVSGLRVQEARVSQLQWREDVLGDKLLKGLTASPARISRIGLVAYLCAISLSSSSRDLQS